MPAAAPPPFPTALVRDLLGLTRLLYRAEQDADMPDASGRRQRLEEVGRAFREALALAGRASAGKGAARSAWAWAGKGAHMLVALVRGTPELENLVRVATPVLIPTASRKSD